MTVLTTIVAWETFQAIGTILIFILLTKILKRWTKEDSEKKKQIQKGFTILVIFMGLAIVFSGFYTVGTNEQVVLTKLTGTKLIIQDVGIHYSFLSSSESYYLGKESLDYPTFSQTSDLSNLFGEEELVTKDGKVIRHSATLFYQINDLYKFAIQSKESDIKLFYYLGSLITTEVSTNTYSDLIQNRRQIEKEVIDSLSDFEDTYGVKILDFKFLRITDSVVTISAKANAEASKLTADATKRNNDLLKESLEGYSSEQLDYLKTKMLSDSGNVKWVIPDSGQVIVNSD